MAQVFDNGSNQYNTGNLDTASFSKKIYFVEPLGSTDKNGNPVSNVVDNKDLVIYVDLKASRRPRTILQINDSNSRGRSVNISDSSINLIGYRINSDGSKTMTTNWSNKPNLDRSKVPGKTTELNSSLSDSVFEGFGVESIDINITAMNPPTVTIKFIDTRGGGLFDQETFNSQTAPINGYDNSTSPYSVFFEMPPPLFYLTIKGYYGHPVTLCLYMTKWDGTFNSETGNFEMTANFLGYTFAFLQDVKIGHLIGAGNTDEGRKKLVKVSSIETEEGLTFPAITLDDLAIKFQRITVKRQEEQKNSEEFQKLKVINEQINFIKKFRSYLGYPTSPNMANTLFGAYLDTAKLKPNREQVFFRDVGLIAKNENTESNYLNLYTVINNGLTAYEELQKGYSSDFFNQAALTKKDITIPEKLDGTQTSRKGIQSAIDEVNKIMLENEPDLKVKATVGSFTAKTQNNWSVDGEFYVLNLKKTRQSLNDKLDSLLEFKKLQEQAIQNKLNREITDILGFQPSISNIIGILCNNIEMFLEMIYDVGVEAQKNNNTSTDNTANNNPRAQELSGYYSDSPDNDFIVYPFPKVVDKDYKEIYLGNIEKLTPGNFPEINFVEKICNGLAYSIKQITEFNQALQSIEKISKLDSFPINTRDVRIDSYSNLDSLPYEKISSYDKATLNREIVLTILKRAFLAYSSSKYRGSAFNKIAELEAINFYKTMVNDTYKNAFNELSDTELIDLGKDPEYGVLGISNTNANNFTIDGFLYPKSFDIDTLGNADSGTRQWDVHLNLKEEINESLKLNPKTDPNNTNSINTSEIDKFTSPKRSTTYIGRFFDSKNVFLNKSYLSVATFRNDNVKNDLLLGTSLDKANLFESYNFLKLLKLDNGAGKDPFGLTNYFYVPRTPQNNILIPLTKTSLYNNTTLNTGKAYLILSSFILETDQLLDDEIGEDYTKIIRVPKIYLLWLGANYYRSVRATDILSFNLEYPTVPKTQFYYPTKGDVKGFTNTYLMSLMEKTFKDWANSDEFGLIQQLYEKLLNTENLSEDERKNICDNLTKLLFQEQDLLVYDSVWMRKGDSFKDETVPQTELSTYVKTFMDSYRSIYAKNGGNNTSDKKLPEPPIKTVVKDKDIKAACYIDLKQIYDNWIAGNQDSNVYSCCKNIDAPKTAQKLKLYDLFKFVDKFRNTIAGDAIININSFNDLIGKKDNGLYSFISKVLTDSYFMHFNLPIFLEFSKKEEVQAIFEPQLTFEKMRSAPSFLCVYNGPPSTNLQSTNNFSNDSFKFSDPNRPKSIYDAKENEQNSYLVAFNVNYGSQAQSIFKNISVGTQESKITGEYITALSNYVQGTGESKPLLKDNSIYPLMRNRSYTSTVQMMGDMMIQPQMYFQLNNIPFFSGSYMIMNVSHQVKANTINTTFKGVRQNRSPVNIVTEVTSFLNFQFNQGIYSSSTFGDVTTTVDPVKQQQTEEANTSVISDAALKNYAPVSGTKILRPFITAEEYHEGIDIEVDSIEQIFTVNKKGVVLANFQGDANTAGRLIIKHDPEEDGYTYFTGYFGITDNNFSVGGNIPAKKNIGNPVSFSSTTVKERTVQPSQPNAIRPNYTFDVQQTFYTSNNEFSGFEAKIYNNGEYIGYKNYDTLEGLTNANTPVTPARIAQQINAIKNQLTTTAEIQGFCGGSFIAADRKEIDFGAYTRGTCYPSYTEFDKQKNQPVSPVTEKYTETTIKYYYHFEIRRTKATINTYEEYLNSKEIETKNPQQFAPNFEVALEKRAIHNNDFYTQTTPTVVWQAGEVVYSGTMSPSTANPPIPWDTAQRGIPPPTVYWDVIKSKVEGYYLGTYEDIDGGGSTSWTDTSASYVKQQILDHLYRDLSSYPSI
jgi:hypothetical protein